MKKGEKYVWISLIIIIIGVIIMAFYEYRYEKNQIIEERIFQVSGINKMEETLDIYTVDGQLFSVRWKNLQLSTDVKTMDEAYVEIPVTDGKPLIDNDYQNTIRYAWLHIPQDIWNSQSVPSGSCLGTLFIALLLLGGVSLNSISQKQKRW